MTLLKQGRTTNGYDADSSGAKYAVKFQQASRAVALNRTLLQTARAAAAAVPAAPAAAPAAPAAAPAAGLKSGASGTPAPVAAAASCPAHQAQAAQKRSAVRLSSRSEQNSRR